MLDGIAQELQAVHDWFVWVAIALIWLVVVSTVSGAFVIWGVLRIARLLEMGAAPRNPVSYPPPTYGSVPANHVDYGRRQ